MENIQFCLLHFANSQPRHYVSFYHFAVKTFLEHLQPAQTA
nr:MAG TPA: hypothetical protein [Caudoviricetes sp.]